MSMEKGIGREKKNWATLEGLATVLTSGGGGWHQHSTAQLGEDNGSRSAHSHGGSPPSPYHWDYFILPFAHTHANVGSIFFFPLRFLALGGSSRLGRPLFR